MKIKTLVYFLLFYFISSVHSNSAVERALRALLGVLCLACSVGRALLCSACWACFALLCSVCFALLSISLIFINSVHSLLFINSLHALKKSKLTTACTFCYTTGSLHLMDACVNDGGVSLFVWFCLCFSCFWGSTSLMRPLLLRITTEAAKADVSKLKLRR